MESNVGIDRIGIQVLTQHQHCLLMLISGFGQKTDVGSQAHISGHLLPHKLECILCRPHVFAASGDGVSLARRIVIDGTLVEHGAHIAVIFKDPNR